MRILSRIILERRLEQAAEFGGEVRPLYCPPEKAFASATSP
jgi:hypothetical protein